MKPAPDASAAALLDPSVSPADLDVVLVFNLLRTHNHLSPLIDADLRRVQLTAAQFNVLLALQSAGEAGLLMGEIGQRLVVTRSNVTGLIDRLERQGLVQRTGHADDRRATLVVLTPAGRNAINEALPSHLDLLRQLTHALTEPEKRTLVALLTKLRRELRQRRKEGA